MKIYIIRHAQVDFCWSRQCTSNEFDMECSRYDSSPVKETACKIPQAEYHRVYVSELSRSLETAEILFPDGDFIKTGLINEVPLRSSFDTEKKLPLWFWNISGRLQWFINSIRQAEGRLYTKERARQFVEIICKGNSDCAVVTHGFYMHILLWEMKKAGFRMNKSSAMYKNGECVIAEKYGAHESFLCF